MKRRVLSEMSREFFERVTALMKMNADFRQREFVKALISLRKQI